MRGKGYWKQVLLVIIGIVLTGCNKENKMAFDTLQTEHVMYAFTRGVYADDYTLYVGEDSLLHFVDLRTDTDAVLCGRADCEHALYSKSNPNPTCFAVGMVDEIFMIDGREMYFTKSRDVTTVDIYYSDNIGITKSQMMTIEGVSTIYGYDYDPDTKTLAFAYQSDYEKKDGDYIRLETPKVGIVVVDFKNKSYRKYMEHEHTDIGREGYRSIDVFLRDDKLVYYKTYYDGSEDEFERLYSTNDDDFLDLMNKYKFIICEYSLLTGEETELITIDNNDIITFDSQIVSYVNGDTYICYDIENREAYPIGEYGRSRFDFIHDSNIGFNYIEGEESVFCLYDMDTGSVKEIYRYYEQDKAVTNCAYTEKSVFLSIYDTMEGTSCDIQMYISDFIDGNFEKLKWKEQ